MIYATFLVPSTISSHVPFRRQIDRSLLEGSPLASVARSSQGGNTGEIHEETWSTCFLTSSLLPFHICSSAKDGQRENKRVNINTSLRFSRLLLSPPLPSSLPSPVSLPKFPFTLFFFFSRAFGQMGRGRDGKRRGEGRRGGRGGRAFANTQNEKQNELISSGLVEGGKCTGSIITRPLFHPSKIGRKRGVNCKL